MVPFKVALVTGVPCTLLRMDLSGDYIAVGASDGQISVFHTEALSRVRTCTVLLNCFWNCCGMYLCCILELLYMD